MRPCKRDPETGAWGPVKQRHERGLWASQELPLMPEIRRTGRDKRAKKNIGSSSWHCWSESRIHHTQHKWKQNHTEWTGGSWMLQSSCCFRQEMNVFLQEKPGPEKNWGGGLGYAVILNSDTATVYFPLEVLKIGANDETFCVVVMSRKFLSKTKGRSVLSARVLCAPNDDLCPGEKGKNLKW